jgi:hypothetical protein
MSQRRTRQLLRASSVLKQSVGNKVKAVVKAEGKEPSKGQGVYNL